MATDFARFFQVSLEMLATIRDGHFAELNPMWTHVLGYSLEELRAADILSLIHPDDRESTVASGGRLMAGEPLVSFENRYLTKAGEYRWLQWSAAMPDPESG